MRGRGWGAEEFSMNSGSLLCIFAFIMSTEKKRSQNGQKGKIKSHKLLLIIYLQEVDLLTTNQLVGSSNLP